LLQSFESFYWSQRHVSDCLAKLSGIRADLYVANDIETLPVVLRLARGAKVLFDAHEYAPREREDQLLFRVLLQKYRSYLCRKYIPRVAAMTTVSEGIALAYLDDTGIEPTVIPNAPDYEDLQPLPVRGMAQPFRLVHHGLAHPERQIEKLIEILTHSNGQLELNLILVESSAPYLARLRRMAKADPRIHFHPLVPMRQLSRFLNQFDIGVLLLEPRNFNNQNALPNKFFEFIQARLALAIGPSPEMAKIVRHHNCGIVAPDFSPKGMAESLERLDRGRLEHCKMRSHLIARELSSEKSRDRLMALVERTLRT
jgi:glycosyltransferase involved in cell wall biosynthesis